MKPGEKFELECTKYLIKNYGKNGVTFIHHDTSNSTSSDIEVQKRDGSSFFIEAKDSNAQAGQFVLSADDINKIFTFSGRNKTRENEFTNSIIKYMNNHYEHYNTAGTKGIDIGIDEEIFVGWIVNHYKGMNVKYIITKNDDDMIIFPLNRFGDYFKVTATFRIKKSGSAAPSKSNFAAIRNYIADRFKCNVNVIEKGDKYALMIPHIPLGTTETTFDLNGRTYYLSPDNNGYQIRQLSNTKNRNVIFSIKTKRSQDYNDLRVFESELI